MYNYRRFYSRRALRGTRPPSLEIPIGMPTFQPGTFTFDAFQRQFTQYLYAGWYTVRSFYRDAANNSAAGEITPTANGGGLVLPTTLFLFPRLRISILPANSRGLVRFLDGPNSSVFIDRDDTYQVTAEWPEENQGNFGLLTPFLPDLTLVWQRYKRTVRWMEEKPLGLGSFVRFAPGTEQLEMRTTENEIITYRRGLINEATIAVPAGLLDGGYVPVPPRAIYFQSQTNITTDQMVVGTNQFASLR